MATTTKPRLHGSKMIEKHVVDLYREGWHVANIASIAKVDAETVREILKRRNIISM